MITLQDLKQISFFKKLKDVLDIKEKYKITEILLPRPMQTENEKELQIIITTKPDFDFSCLTGFNAVLPKILGDEIIFAVFSHEGLLQTINEGDAMASTYKKFLTSAIPVEQLKDNEPLDSQWRIQENRATALEVEPAHKTTIKEDATKRPVTIQASRAVTYESETPFKKVRDEKKVPWKKG